MKRDKKKGANREKRKEPATRWGRGGRPWEAAGGRGMGRGRAGGVVTSGGGLPPWGAVLPAGGLRNSPALSPALPFSSGGGGGGRDGSAHSGGSSAPGLGCCFWGGGGSGSGSGPARTVTIVRCTRRSRAEPLSSRRRRRPWPPPFAPPAPGALRRPRPGFRTLRLRAAQPAWRAPPPPLPRAPAFTHNRARGVLSAPPPVRGRET